MNVLAKKLSVVALVMVATVLSASNSHNNKTILYDFCDYLEINNVYKIDEKTGSPKLRFVQYVWWEWRDHVLTPALNPYTGEKTGFSKRTSGFVVRDYIIVRNSYLKTDITSQKVNTHLSRTKVGWSCIYNDFSGKTIRHVSFKWVIISHTFYDSELNNRDMLSLQDRNEFLKR